MKKQVINGEVYDVFTEREYFDNPELINNYDRAAIMDGYGYTYPVMKRSGEMKEVGAYCRNRSMIRYKDPQSEAQKKKYSSDNIIDFDNVNSTGELLEKTSIYKDLEKEILISPDNAYMPKDFESDSNMMGLAKEAMRLKHCDKNKYRSRFGNTFNNDMKIFDSDDITLLKAKRIFEKFDIKMTVTLEDKNPDVANPMNKTISAVITDEN